MVKVKRPQPQLAMGPCRFVNCGSAPKLRVQSYTRAYGQVLSDRELAQRAHFVTPSYQPLFPVVEALMRRYGFGRLRIWVKPADVDIRWPGNLLWYAENFTQHFNIQLHAAMYHNSHGPYQ